MIKGTYTNTKFDGNLIYKNVSPDSGAEKYIFETLSKDVDINEYIAKISHFVELPEICEYENNVVKQNIIEGKNVDEYLMEADINDDKVVTLYRSLVQIYKNIKQDDSLTLDFNLFNFIVKDEENLVFVDVTPPLFTEKIEQLDDRFMSQRELFLNKPLQLTSFSMYFMMPFIIRDTKKEDLDELYTKMLGVISEEDLIDDYNQSYDHIFSTRRDLFETYLNENVENFKEDFLSFDIKNDLNTLGEELCQM